MAASPEPYRSEAARRLAARYRHNPHNLSAQQRAVARRLNGARRDDKKRDPGR